MSGRKINETSYSHSLVAVIIQIIFSPLDKKRALRAALAARSRGGKGESSVPFLTTFHGSTKLPFGCPFMLLTYIPFSGDEFRFCCWWWCSALLCVQRIEMLCTWRVIVSIVTCASAKSKEGRRNASASCRSHGVFALINQAHQLQQTNVNNNDFCARCIAVLHMCACSTVHHRPIKLVPFAAARSRQKRLRGQRNEGPRRLNVYGGGETMRSFVAGKRNKGTQFFHI